MNDTETMRDSTASLKTEFDPNALRDKYRAERQKRIRPGGIGQYIEADGEFAYFADDPYTERRSRVAVQESVETLIIGGGLGGLSAAAHLKQVGVDNIRIIEKGGDFGGTWYWNRYPGAQCDIESYVYLPFLEETGYMPREKYSYQPEILAHAQRIAHHFGLYARALFHTRIVELRWSDEGTIWHVTTDRDDHFEARFVITCCGTLEKPKLPGIPGIKSFKGHTFHTSRWDYGYTGGDTSGNLTKLADKRVGVIGTGATAVQCIPHLGRHAAQLYVFQRTPSTVNARGNKPTDPAWAALLTPGWQKRRVENFSSLILGYPVEEDMVDDGWTQVARRMAGPFAARDQTGESAKQLQHKAEMLDFKVMNEVRARVAVTVKDSRTAEVLQPWFRYYCKRPTFNDDYLPTFNRPNVTLVDTVQGIDRISEAGPVVGGKEHAVDCLVFATGFEVGTNYQSRTGFEIRGRNGLTLSDYWKDGPRTLYGLTSHGFPNLFFMGATQVGATTNLCEMLFKQATHIADVVKTARQRRARIIEAGTEAEAAWVNTIIDGNEAAVAFQAECSPSYYNNEGAPKRNGWGIADSAYAPGILEWDRVVTTWRENGFDGLVIA